MIRSGYDDDLRLAHVIADQVDSLTMTRFKALDLTVQAGLKMGLAKGLATGANGVTFILWAVMAWYGSLLIINRGLGGGTVLVCGLAAMMGGL